MKYLETYKIFENVKFVKQTKKEGAKTDTYNVSKSGDIIGQVKWSSRHRGYSFLPTPDCEPEIKEFVKELMAKRRKMKKIKKNEQFEFNEDWEDEDPDKDKGPFDDQIIYGKDGPDFKCRDRIVYINKDPNRLIGKIGTVVDYSNDFDDYAICFDDEICYTNGNYFSKKFNFPNENGKIVTKNEIKLL